MSRRRTLLIATVAYLCATATWAPVIYWYFGHPPIPRPMVPSCETVVVSYVSRPDETKIRWGYWRQEIQCPGPDGKVRIGW